MSESAGTIIKEVTIGAPAHLIYDALVNPSHRLQWWSRTGRFKAVRMESDLRAGGKWRMEFENDGMRSSVEGKYTIIQPPYVLEFTWLPSWDPGVRESLVRFDLHETEGITCVRVTHSGIDNDISRERHGGWDDLLTALRSYIETQSLEKTTSDR